MLYASLYPFAAWRWPPGRTLLELALLPWPPWLDPFDLWANGLGYLPLGLLAAFAATRSGLGPWGALAIGLGAPSLLSYACELLQHFVPTRHPSLKDWAMNSAGAAVGVLVALVLHRLGWGERWHALRARWFAADSAGALALLALWPVGLLVPVPVPLGLGQVHEELRQGLLALLADLPWAEALRADLAAAPARTRALAPLAETVVTALGLLAPCLIAFTVTPAPWRRAALAVGALVLALAIMTLSTLLNFGPLHAHAWMGTRTLPALGAGLVMALVFAPLPRAVILGLALMVLTGLAVGVAQAPADPYFAQSLQSWEQGRFVRFHGLAQWVGWLWPYAALGWLLVQLAQLGRRR